MNMIVRRASVSQGAPLPVISRDIIVVYLYTTSLTTSGYLPLYEIPLWHGYVVAICGRHEEIENEAKWSNCQRLNV